MNSEFSKFIAATPEDRRDLFLATANRIGIPKQNVEKLRGSINFSFSSITFYYSSLRRLASHKDQRSVDRVTSARSLWVLLKVVCLCVCRRSCGWGVWRFRMRAKVLRL